MEAGEVDLLLLHCAAPATLACSGVFPAKSGIWASGLVFASIINLHTEAREMPCFLATCVRLMPERRSRITCSRFTSSRARPICRPSKRARRIPARTRSMMMHRSSSAAHYDEDRPAKRSLGVDSFTLAQELNTHPVQLVNGLEQVLR